MGFDYQLWVTMKTNKLELKINTSIKHPKQLFNDKFKTRRVIVTKDGETVIKESLEHYIQIVIVFHLVQDVTFMWTHSLIH